MRTFTILLGVTVLAFLSTSLRAADDVLATLRAGHPRLILLNDDIARIKACAQADALAKQWFAELTKVADEVIGQPVSEYVLIGPRLLQVSRQVLGRVTLLSGLYRITGEKRYADRAIAEMLAAAKFQDWHPSHFLDTAEMTNAVGIGYDWLFDVLTPEQRAILKSAIIEKGLKPGIEYQGKIGLTRTNNWNQVCNGGLTVGALAVADEDPQIARQIINSAVAALPPAMEKFAPDGGCEEGPGYWSYAMRYTAYFISATRSALGTDFGIAQSPGLADAGMFRIHSASPIRQNFNFADAGSNIGRAAEMMYFAQIFDRPVYAAHERLLRDDGKVDPFHLFWFNPAGSKADIEKLPLAAAFRRIHVAMMRSGWGDPNAAFVGFKGGDNRASHAHADLGTFVYDVDGVRWAVDLGADDYNLPGYFGGKRYDYYRLRTEGHNTITIGNENQNIKAAAPLLAFSDKPGSSYAVADLTRGYAPQAKRAHRGVQLLGRALLVQDEIEADEPIDVVWNLHTLAKVQIDPSGTMATLTRGDKTLSARIVSPAGAKFDTISANPPPPQKQQPEVVNLIVRQPEKVKSLRLVVLLSPAQDNVENVKVGPLGQWIADAPIHP